jgi:hypothetical protein
MQAARWADDIRTQGKAQNRPPWHYINVPFKPEGQPPTVQIRKPEPVNILTVLQTGITQQVVNKCKSMMLLCLRGSMTGTSSRY